MSHLARELDRQLLWIEKQAKDLMAAIDDLVRAGNKLMSSTDGWDEVQADVIRVAVRDWADNCGRSIAYAQTEVAEFHRQLTGPGDRDHFP